VDCTTAALKLDAFAVVLKTAGTTINNAKNETNDFFI
jgi:hypothetical protein